MPSDLGLIAMSIISLIGLYIITQSNFRNWCKKKNFLQQIKVQNLKYKALEKELGLKYKSTGNQQSMQTNIAPDNDISDLVSYSVERYLNKDDDEEEGAWLQDIIGNAMQSNPDLVKGIVGKITSGKKKEEEQQYLGD